MAKIPRNPEFGKPAQWGRLYSKHFPHNTDGASRHVKCFAEQLRAERGPVRARIREYFDPDHIASSMELTVIALWEARARIAELEATLTKQEP